ncbi:exopolysaccharide biosynthesis polyprenyl glycosylphosphotransferase [Seonamhaeicola sp. MEBiC1930]|uniref:exopolysaccharide biosynthesis polyprenyl glycosylphosphotransferase n=1 Tax=Seonamhaeicola sp. MEBiC01930 TaxID=2976768 RepID=UPI00325468C3
MGYIRGRYSWLLRPILMVCDITIINVLSFSMLDLNNEDLYFFSSDFLNNKDLLYGFYSGVLWLLSTYALKFYKVYRYTTILNILSLLTKQFFLYSIIVFAFLGVFRSVNLPSFVTFNYLLYCFLAIGFFKVSSYYLLKLFRSYLKGNIRNIIVIGKGENAVELLKFFETQKDLGYEVKKTFGINGSNLNDSIVHCFEYLENHKNIDEIYCAIDELNEKEVNNFVKYANLNHCNIKFIPSNFKFFTKRLHTDYYNYLPVLTFQEGVLNNEFNKVIKRIFDIIFSLFIIIFVMSWVSIILFVLIKLESKGPLFYRHKRNGINYKEFDCYKYRSLFITKEIEGSYVQQNDSRVTKIGKFLRRTSIDELPQFINVFKGDMSVVGPRPHMLSYTDEYSKKIDKYNFIFRHQVKPGVTGLAQIKGYRGEIEIDTDIINRIKYDIFYIENWSLLLDLKIIFQTVIGIFKGDIKAY